MKVKETTEASLILVAGVGNIFLGDDGFGIEVVRRLAEQRLPDEVRVRDFGIRCLDLTYALLDRRYATILVDATRRGGVPGTLYTMEPDMEALSAQAKEEISLETHGMNLMKVLGSVRALGGELPRMLLVGCEPETFGPEEGQIGLSEPVQAAVDEAVRVVQSLIAQLLEGFSR